ncbi:uncharacterized protein PV07_02656 [Cladophialophora immunda]|uniref:Uncharacterized protein n=1 Tax=Cladophialophora immunda TaxID=569365 RepID=A0A0D2CLQ9_9EURO|nr:uncharacterized protein PV07_02656 [Cladophialophora immunda]KIW30970.1 hypothetical protein PV07_02656 [Cladophialophora immunda]OQV05637.1 hypothetical protein CLAIMM_10340 [Cladophialophora immunda]
MSGLRSVMKDGWHPKGRDGGKESWRGDFKGINQVAGWMGKGRDPNKKDGDEHMSRPLSTLKDPASFGPPPKNVNYHGGAALPNEITPQTGGWGAPLTQEQISSASRAVRTPEEEEEEEQKNTGPPLPYRADRTGLKTDHLPPPPIHRDLNRSLDVVETAPAKPKPGLPPRLPSRQNTGSTPTPPPVVNSPLPTTAPPAYDAVPAPAPSAQGSASYGINQAAVNRLGNAGISVPALGIGSDQNSNPWHNEPSQANVPKSPPVASPPPVNQLSELQARFARMNSNSSAGQQSNTTPPFVTPAQSPPPVTANAPPVQQSHALQPQPQPQSQAQGTTWAEKQAAMRTAQNAYKDPASVSAADAGSAVRTANTFRERHQDSISAAGLKANQWNKKYNVTGRLNSFLEKHSSSSPTPEDAQSPNGTNAGGNAPLQASPPNQTAEMAASISRKPPPPPPPKKPANMHGSVGSMGVAPPPVPLGTKPSYS